jgi:hypothetical protein
MNLRDFLGTIAGSGIEDWTILFRPTYRHRIIEVAGAEGGRDRLDADEHLVAFSYKPDLALTMAYGMVEQPSVRTRERTDTLSRHLHRGQAVVSGDRGVG